MKRTTVLSLIMFLYLSQSLWASFQFVAWADNRPYDAANEARFVWMLQQMNILVGSTPAFHVVPGDYDLTNTTEVAIANHSNIQNYYLVPGNHDPERNSGHDVIDYPSTNPESRLILLDEYYCPSGTCDCSMGRVCSHTLLWMRDRLDEAETQGLVPFVVGHEPAYPQNRHIGDSLDTPEYIDERNAFTAELASHNAPYICGHTHYYSEHSEGGITQIDVGNAGNPGDAFQTFVLFEVSGDTYSATAYHTEYNVSAYPQASNPMPATNSDGISTTPVLTWTGGSGAQHQVYFAPASAGLPIGPTTKTSEASFTVKNFFPPELEYNTPYVWRVDEYYDDDHLIEGEVWTFRTKEEISVRRAISESTTYGTVVGDIDGTENRDDVYEEITEVSNVPNKNGYGILDHTWRFENVPSGENMQLRLEAFRTAFDESDVYELSYSNNGSSFTPLMTISKTSDDNHEDIVNLTDPGTLSGTVWVRVTNSDRTKRSQIFDTLFVDCLYLVSSDETIPEIVVEPTVGNLPPVAIISGGDQTVTDGEAVTLDARESFDPEGGALVYEWDLNGDGKIDETESTITHTFVPGIHTITLKVTDDMGASATDSVKVNVQVPGGSLNVAKMVGLPNLKGASGQWTALVTVTIYDQADKPVFGATVHGLWTGDISGTVSGVTNVDGMVTLGSEVIKKGTTATLTITSIDHEMSYTPPSPPDHCIVTK